MLFDRLEDGGVLVLQDQLAQDDRRLVLDVQSVGLAQHLLLDGGLIDRLQPGLDKLVEDVDPIHLSLLQVVVHRQIANACAWTRKIRKSKSLKILPSSESDFIGSN